MVTEQTCSICEGDWDQHARLGLRFQGVKTKRRLTQDEKDWLAGWEWEARVLTDGVRVPPGVFVSGEMYAQGVIGAINSTYDFNDD